MKYDTIERQLIESSSCDILFDSPLQTTNGWKISILGQELSHSILLFSLLSKYLQSKNVAFKLGTALRYSLRHSDPQQSIKAMTIYCPDGFDVGDLCRDIHQHLIDYRGGINIQLEGYQHYKGSVYFRNDRDKDGNYLPAKS